MATIKAYKDGNAVEIFDSESNIKIWINKGYKVEGSKNKVKEQIPQTRRSGRVK